MCSSERCGVIVSRGVDLRVNRSLELLQRLHQTVAEFAKKEAELSTNLRNRRAMINRKYREAMEQTENKMGVQVEETESACKAEEQRIRSIFESRRARIEKTRLAGLRHLPKRAPEA